MAGFGSRGGLRLVGAVRKDAYLAPAVPRVESQCPKTPEPVPPTKRLTGAAHSDGVESIPEREGAQR